MFWEKAILVLDAQHQDGKLYNKLQNSSKNEVVAPKLRFQNTIFEAVLELVLNFAILVLNHQHQNGFFPEHLAPKFVLPLYLFCT